jgi:hypothetical protein
MPRDVNRRSGKAVTALFNHASIKALAVAGISSSFIYNMQWYRIRCNLLIFSAALLR